MACDSMVSHKNSHTPSNVMRTVFKHFAYKITLKHVCVCVCTHTRVVAFI